MLEVLTGAMRNTRLILFSLLVLLVGLTIVIVRQPVRSDKPSLVVYEPKESANDRMVIEVNCPDPQGCFLLLGQTLATAPEGAIINIGPGLYYEKPIVIPKSIHIRGEGAGESEIRLIEPGAAFTIESPMPLSFSVQGISVRTRVLELPEMGQSLQNSGIRWKQSRNSARQSILLQEVAIVSSTAIAVEAWEGEIRVKNSQLQGISGISVLGGGDLSLAVVESSLLGPCFLQRPNCTYLPHLWGSAITIVSMEGEGAIQAIVQGNRFSGWGTDGVYAASPGLTRGWANILIYLEENRIQHNRYGIRLAGEVEANIIANEILNNDEYGVVLSLPPCLSSPPPMPFQGVIRGVQNEIRENRKADLCPEDYPWPEDFSVPNEN